jgi:hypothetical protein
MTHDDGRAEGSPSRCPNCSAEVTQEFCPQCGQRRIELEELSARHFWNEMADDVTNFRTRFKTVRTLQGLLVPGLLTAEYLAGRRQQYLSPLKTYLVCAGIFFLSAPMAGFTLSSMLDADRSGVIRRLVVERTAHRPLEPPVFDARFDAHVQSVYTVTIGTVAVLFALALQALFRKQRWPYGAHLIFALHYVSVIYLLTIAAGLSRRIGLSLDAAALRGYAVILPYLIFALKRVYEESAGALALKGLALLVLTAAMNSLANFAAIRITLALV